MKKLLRLATSFCLLSFSVANAQEEVSYEKNDRLPHPQVVIIKSPEHAHMLRILQCNDNLTRCTQLGSRLDYFAAEIKGSTYLREVASRIEQVVAPVAGIALTTGIIAGCVVPVIPMAESPLILAVVPWLLGCGGVGIAPAVFGIAAIYDGQDRIERGRDIRRKLRGEETQTKSANVLLVEEFDPELVRIVTNDPNSISESLTIYDMTGHKISGPSSPRFDQSVEATLTHL